MANVEVIERMCLQFRHVIKAGIKCMLVLYLYCYFILSIQYIILQEVFWPMLTAWSLFSMWRYQMWTVALTDHYKRTFPTFGQLIKQLASLFMIIFVMILIHAVLNQRLCFFFLSLSEFIKQRRTGLHEFIQKIVTHPQLSNQWVQQSVFLFSVSCPFLFMSSCADKSTIRMQMFALFRDQNVLAMQIYTISKGILNI